MKTKRVMAVYKANETLTQSIYKDFVTFIMVCFCVYISQGSTFWTFVTGLMFMLFLFSKASAILGNSVEFKTKEELKAWVDNLPEDEVA